jgi:1,4-alpha-glucan branching enzyme
MAVQEHPYYGSFGYHVSSFFAVSSRCGTPEDLKQLIDEAHGLGLKVFLDIVHSHSVKNTHEGLTGFDGSDHQYFHSGARGLHPVWDSSLFDYTKYEVRRFLLSNVRFWLEEFNFDGFRFDGITSMLYHHHGFSDTKYDTYDPYFDSTVDEDSLLYLKLANEVAHATYPEAVTIAEEVTGMPGLARPVSEMGLGFDYRLAMGIQSTWFSNISKKRDEAWVLDDIFAALLNRRRDEKHIGYVESHDEALVGDKTLAFWLMDKEMYTGMDNLSGNLIVDRGIALHKMIRLMTFSCGGEGYLNFMGNEFGHPEWIDFPNKANGYSHDFARRQWSLADNGFLRYQGLDQFDIAMQSLDIHFGIMLEPAIDQLALHEADRYIAYRRGPLVFVFNYNATRSFEEFRLPLPEAEDYILMLSTDEEQFRGHARVSPMANFPWLMEPKGNWAQSTNIYLPSRSALVFAPRRLLDQVTKYRETLV